MITISKTALAAALLAGAGAIATASPAMAAKQKDAQAQQTPQLKLSDEFRKAAGPAQQALNSGDYATAATGIRSETRSCPPRAEGGRRFARRARAEPRRAPDVVCLGGAARPPYRLGFENSRRGNVTVC